MTIAIRIHVQFRDLDNLQSFKAEILTYDLYHVLWHTRKKFQL